MNSFHRKALTGAGLLFTAVTVLAAPPEPMPIEFFAAPSKF